MGIKESHLRVEGQRRRRPSYQDTLQKAIAFIQRRDFESALLVLERYAYAKHPRALLRKAGSESSTSASTPILLRVSSHTEGGAAIDSLLDEARLEVCTALNKVIKSKLCETTADEIITLCAIGAVLGVGEEGEEKEATGAEKLPYDVSKSIFESYINAAISLNIVRVQGDLENSYQEATEIDVFKEHFDLVESLIHILNVYAPPGSPLGVGAFGLINKINEYSINETNIILGGYEKKVGFDQILMGLAGPETDLDPIPIEKVLLESSSIILQCKLHERFISGKLGLYRDKLDASRAAWEAAIECFRGRAESSATDDNLDYDEPKTVDINAFLSDGNDASESSSSEAVVDRKDEKQEVKEEEEKERIEEDGKEEKIEEQNEEQEKEVVEEEEGPEFGPNYLEPVPLFPVSFFSMLCEKEAPGSAFPRKAEEERREKEKKEGEGKEEKSAKEASEKKKEEEKEEKEKAAPKAEEAPVNTIEKLTEEFTKLLQILTGYYAAVEASFTEHVIQAAFTVGRSSLPSEDEKSPLVDDVFYALTTSMERSAATMEATAFVTTTTNANAKLSSELFSVLNGWVIEWNSSPESRRIVSFFAVLNEISTAEVNTRKLREHAMALLSKYFAGSPQIQRIVACLDDFAHTEKGFHALLAQNVTRVARSVLSNAHAPFEAFMGAEYRVDKEQYLGFEVNDPYMLSLIQFLGTVFESFTPLLTPSNGDLLVENIAVEVIKKLEEIAFQKRFSQLGALQFAKEIQGFSDFCAAHSKAPLQGRFARIKQVAHILGLDAPADALGISWKLKPEEVKAVLLLRSDFKPEDVNSLDFTPSKPSEDSQSN